MLDANGQELVTIPARLLLHLYWALECLSEFRDDEDDEGTLAAARDALMNQAPRHHHLLVVLDEPATATTQGD